MPTQAEGPNRPHYGRVYQTTSELYTARIWDPDGRDIWHSLPTGDPKHAFMQMRAEAARMEHPVTLYWRDGTSEQTEGALPF